MLNPTEPIHRACSVCGAHAGERCKDAEDHLMEDFHRSRLTKVEQLAGPHSKPFDDEAPSP